MTLAPHKKVVFFLCLLISFSLGSIKAQEVLQDTLKKVTNDTITFKDSDESLDEKINYEANDSIVSVGSEQRAILYGKSKITYGELVVEAEIIEMDNSKNILTAYGKKDSLGKPYGLPVFKDDQQEIRAEKIMYNLKTKRGKIFGALTKQGEMLVFGNEIKKDSSNVIYMKGMKCVPCQEEDSRTAFRATRAKIIPDDKIVTGPMYLEIGGAPTPLALPFGFFPNTQHGHNGILIPTFGRSDNQGFFLRDGGYYWGINTKTDMTIRGDFFSNGSWGIRTFNNYKILYRSYGALNLGYSEYVEGDKDLKDLENANGKYKKIQSYSIRWTHTQDNKSNPSVRFFSDVNYVNQQYNKYNSFNSGQFLQNTFQSNVNFTKTYKWSSLSLNATHNQNTITRQMDLTLPALTFNVNRFYPLRNTKAGKIPLFDKVGLNYILESRNTLSGPDTSIFKGDVSEKMKYGIKQGLPIATNFNMFKYITVTPALSLNNYIYTKSIEKEYIDGDRDTLVTNTVKEFTSAFDYRFSTGFNTKVYFDYAFRSGRVTQIRHLFIPTLSYYYNPDFGDDKYGYWKSVQRDTLGNQLRYSKYESSIYGGPSPGAQNALGINLSNNIEAKLKQKTDSGFNYVKTVLLQDLSVNTAYNFVADSFKMSDINVSARSKVLKYFDVVASALFDPYAYNGENKRINAFAYSYNGVLANFRSAYFTVNTSFGSNMVEALKKTRQAPNMTNAVERGASVSTLSRQERMSWNLNVYYNLALDNTQGTKLRPTQTLNFRGDIAPTKYWKLGMTSGFDFNTKTLSYTSINVHRDLKCWEVAIDWVPFGFNKRYSIFINLKTPALSSIKIPRQKAWYDNIQ